VLQKWSFAGHPNQSLILYKSRVLAYRVLTIVTCILNPFVFVSKLVLLESALKRTLVTQATYRRYKRASQVSTFNVLYSNIFTLRKVKYILFPINDFHCSIGLPFSYVTCSFVKMMPNKIHIQNGDDVFYVLQQVNKLLIGSKYNQCSYYPCSVTA
jgi:uncharacterized membrane protein